MALARVANAGKRTFGCGGCPTRWTGLRTAHCAACHQTFNAPTGFDKHRKRGQCVDPRSVGLRRNHRGYWGEPGGDWRDGD